MSSDHLFLPLLNISSNVPLTMAFTIKPSSPFWKCGVVGISSKACHLWRMPDDNMSLQDPVLGSFVWVIRHCDSPCPAKGVNSTLSLGAVGKFLCVPICNTEPDPYPLCNAWRLGNESVVEQRVWWPASYLVCLFLRDAVAISLPVLLQWHRMRQRHKAHAHMLFLIVRKECFCWTPSVLLW